MQWKYDTKYKYDAINKFNQYDLRKAKINSFAAFDTGKIKFFEKSMF